MCVLNFVFKKLAHTLSQELKEGGFLLTWFF